MLSIKYKTVKQHDMKDCAPACIATLLRHYGSKVHISTIREIAGTSLSGTNALGVVKCLEKLEFETKAIRADMGVFEDKTLPYPAIAHTIRDNLLHFVVIQKVGKNHLIISDPAEGLIKISKTDFEEIWSGVLIFAIPKESYVKLTKESGFLGIAKILLKDKKLIFHIVVVALLTMLIGIATSFYFQLLIDTLIPQNTTSTLHVISIGIIVLYIFQALFDTVKNYLLTVLGNRMSIRLMLGYYNHVLKLNFSFFDTRKAGEIISRFMDASKVINALAKGVLTIILDVLMVIVIGAVLFYQNSRLFGVTLVTIPFYAIIILTFVKTYDKLNRKEMESNSILNSYIIESLNGIETIKALQAEKKVSKRVDRLFVDYLNAMFKTFNIDNIQTLLKVLLQSISSVAVLWIGSVYVINGDMSIGQLITFNMLANYLSTPLQNIINLQPEFQTAKVASDRINEIMVIEPEITESENQKINSDTLFNGDIQIKNVHFNYPMRRECLTDINIDIKSGDKVAFIGKSGTGKSTLAKLLLSYYPATQGSILYNGYNMQDINKESLRKNITLVPQTAFFFSGTLFENLVFGLDKNIKIDKVMRACEDACISEYIESLPLRYDTLVEENASNFSGGQKQRFAIARALLRKNPILILDEATSSIDGFTEHEIIHKLIAKKKLTLIIIAHRLSVVKRCTNIFVLDENEIVENGNHKDLMIKKGLYYRMWKSIS